MTFNEFNPIDDIFEKISGSLGDIFNNIFQAILNFIFILLPYLKFLVATIILILGIRMMPTSFKFRRDNKMDFQKNGKKRYTNIYAAIVFIILAFGIYFNFLSILIWNLVEPLPGGLLFTLLSLNDFAVFQNIIIPFTPEWDSLSLVIQFGLIIMMLISLVEFTLFIYGCSLIVIRGYNGTKEGSILIFKSGVVLFLVGISPGIILLLI